MKIFLNLLLLIGVILPGSSVFAAGYCPTSAEVQAKSQMFQLKALNLMSNTKGSMNEADKLIKEQEAFHASLLDGCLQYFSTPGYHDCNKLITLQTAYFILPSAKQPAYKPRVDAIYEKFKTTCSAEYQTYKIMVK